MFSEISPVSCLFDGTGQRFEGKLFLQSSIKVCPRYKSVRVGCFLREIDVCANAGCLFTQFFHENSVELALPEIRQLQKIDSLSHFSTLETKSTSDKESKESPEH